MKIIEMLRLSEMGLTQRQIAAGAGCARSTVGEVLKLCKDKSIDFALAKQKTAEELHSFLYPVDKTKQRVLPEPDWRAIREELAKHKNLNLQFLWEEYRSQYPGGLSYSRFCVHYRQYREAIGKEVYLHNERKAGEVMEVDWMGDTLDCVVSEKTGEIMKAHFFVSIIGYSGYPYVEAFPNEREINWITGNVNALHYYGGAPRLITPDNLKAAVKTPRYYEPIINSSYWELAQHYGVAIIPTRVGKARDKSLVEQSVGWLETWLLGKLRKQMFFSFTELNLTIRGYISELSQKPFQKREGSRLSEFIEIDKPALRPLPAQRYEIADIVARRVGDNYHLEYDRFYYSVPYTLHGEMVMLRATGATIEVFDRNHLRMASHKRRYLEGISPTPIIPMARYVTDEAHMPPNHVVVYRARQFDGKRYLAWAQKIGESAHFIIDGLLTSGPVEEQGYKSCMGVLQLSKTYGDAALEAACTRARALGSCTYTTVKSILKTGTVDNARRVPLPTPLHENIRGGEYYN
jgi:transposase